MLKFLFFILMFYVGYKVIKLLFRSLFLPFDNSMEQQQDFYRNQASEFGFQDQSRQNNNSGEGNVTIYRTQQPSANPNDRKDLLKDAGDYTDFEEVK